MRYITVGIFCALFGFWVGVVCFDGPERWKIESEIFNETSERLNKAHPYAMDNVYKQNRDSINYYYGYMNALSEVEDFVLDSKYKKRK